VVRVGQIKKAIARGGYPPGGKSGRGRAGSPPRAVVRSPLAVAVGGRKLTCRDKAAAASEFAFGAFHGEREEDCGIGDRIEGWAACPN
jgi:hypothetical protein